MLSDSVDLELSRSCIELESRYQLNFIEIGTDKDHVHFFGTICSNIQIVVIKSITARNIFKVCTYVKKKLRDGELRMDVYFANSIGKHGDENMIANYVKN